MNKLHKLLLIYHCKLLIRQGNGVLAFGYQKTMLKLRNRTRYLSDREALAFRYLRRAGKLRHSIHSYTIVGPHSGPHHFDDDCYTI